MNIKIVPANKRVKDEIEKQANAAFKVDLSSGAVVEVRGLPPKSVFDLDRKYIVCVELRNTDLKHYFVPMNAINDLFASEKTHLLKEDLEEWRDNGYPSGAIFSTPRELQ